MATGTLFTAHASVLATATTVYTMPAGNTGFIGNITCYNSAGGDRTLTLTVTESDGTVVTLAVETIGTLATASYSGGSTRRVTPLVMLGGNILKATGDNTGLVIRCSGIRFTT